MSDKPRVVILVRPLATAAPVTPATPAPTPEPAREPAATPEGTPTPPAVAEPAPSKPKPASDPRIPKPWSAVVMVGCAVWLIAFAVALRVGAVEPQASGAAKVAQAVEPGRAHAWLTRLQAEHGHRWRGTTQNRTAPKFIGATFKEIGAYAVRHEVFDEQELANVHARIPGRDPTRSVVLAAHHDVVQGTPGAVDDGGGIAAIVEAARAILASGEKPACDIELIIFDGEEIEPPSKEGKGIRGSMAHLSALDAEGRARVRAALAVELVGWKEDQLVVHTIPHGFQWDAAGITPAWVPESVRVAGSQVDAPVALGDSALTIWYQGTVRNLSVFTGSDAGAYAHHGIPSAMLAGSSVTNFYGHYHRSGDDMSQVSSERLDDAARVVAVAALELAERAAGEPRRELGEAWFMVGLHTLRRPALIGLMAGAALILLLAAIGLARLPRQKPTAVLAVVAALGLAALALTADVMSFYVAVPLCLGVAAGSFQRGGWAVMFVGRVPLYLQGIVFLLPPGGFQWRGNTPIGVLLCVVALAGVLAGMRLKKVRAVAARV